MRGMGGLGGHAAARAVENVTAESGNLCRQPVVHHEQGQAWRKRRAALGRCTGTLGEKMEDPHAHTHTLTLSHTHPLTHSHCPHRTVAVFTLLRL